MRALTLSVLALICVSILGCAAPAAVPPAPTAVPPAPTAVPPAPTAVPAAPTAVPPAPTAVPPAPSATPTKPPAKSGTLRFFHILNYDMRSIPEMMALDDLQAQGYNVTQTSLSSSALIADALSRGDADVATFNNQTMWTAIAKGATPRTMVQGTQSSPFLLVNQTVKSCRDLDGKSVALPAPTGLNPSLFDAYFKDHCPGVKPQVVVIAEAASRSAALQSGQIDGVLVQFEETLLIEQSAPGKFQRLVDFSKEYPLVLVNGIQVSETWAKQNPQIAKDFIRALLTAHRRMNDNPQVLYDEGVKRLGLTPAIAKQVGDAILQGGMFDPNGGLTKENVQYTLDFLAGIKSGPAGLKADDVADFSYLNAVLDEMGRR